MIADVDVRNAYGTDPGKEGERPLVLRAVAGDRDAIARLYAGCHPHLVRHIARYCADPEVAQEVAQDVWVKALRALPAYEPNGSRFVTWLYRIGVRALIDRRRHERLLERERWEAVLAGPEADSAAFVADREETPERRQRAAENRAEVEEILARMAPRYRRALELRFYRELTRAELAAALGVAPGSVKQVMYRAYRQFRALLAATERRPEADCLLADARPGVSMLRPAARAAKPGQRTHQTRAIRWQASAEMWGGPARLGTFATPKRAAAAIAAWRAANSQLDAA